MKKLVAVVTAVFLVSSAFAGGGKAAEARTEEKTLIAQGLSLAALMHEKADSETYLALMGGNDEAMVERIREIGEGDVSRPQAVYRLGGDFSEFCSMMLSGLGGVLNAEFASQFSPELKEDIEKRFLSSVASLWNAKTTGATGMAATSILASGTAFDCAELKADCLYIFTFKDAYPVAVSFTRGQGNAVSASASFVMSRDFVAELSALLSEMDIGLNVEQIQ